jgi:hypothetical protein
MWLEEVTAISGEYLTQLFKLLLAIYSLHFAD